MSLFPSAKAAEKRKQHPDDTNAHDQKRSVEETATVPDEPINDANVRLTSESGIYSQAPTDQTTND